MNQLDEKLCKHLGSIHIIDKDVHKGFQHVHGDIWIMPTIEKIGFTDVGTGCKVLRVVKEYEEHSCDLIKLSTIPDIYDLHKWMCNNTHENQEIAFTHYFDEICFYPSKGGMTFIPYDSSKSLLQQSDTIKESIVKLFEEYVN